MSDAPVYPTQAFFHVDVQADVAPLSTQQWRHWLIEQTGIAGDAYHMPTLLRCSGPLDPRSVTRAVTLLRRRHAVLRVAYPVVGGRPLQLLSHQADLEVPWIDLQRLSSPDARPEVDRDDMTWNLIQKVASERFDLHNGPLFRVCVFRLSPDNHYLLLNFHHSICDAWSLEIIARDFFEAYSSSESETAATAEEDLSYLEYARRAQPPEPDALEFWRRALNLARVYLPLAGGRGVPGAKESGLFRTYITGDDLVAIHKFCRERGITLFMFVMTAFHLVLRVASGRSDQLVGTVVAGRPAPDLRNTVGCFVNYLPIRLVSPHAGSLDELIESVKLAVLRALEHQHCSFDEIVRIAPVRGNNPRNPLFNVGLVLQNTAVATNWPGNSIATSFTPVSAPPIEPTLDLRLSVMETANKLELCWEYDQRLLDKEWVGSMGQSFELMLARIRTSNAAIEECLDGLPGELRARVGFELRIASSGGAEPLTEIVDDLCGRLGVDLHISMLPAHRIDSVSARRGGLTVLLLRPADWADAGDDATTHLVTSLKALEDEVLVIVERWPDRDEDTGQWIADVRAAVGEHGEIEWQAVAVPEQELDLLTPVGARYGPLFLTAASVVIAKRIYQILSRDRPYKVLVLDCDDTLWTGACGEAGQQGVVIDEPRHALQRFALEQRARGLLLCLCSRNDEEDVKSVFTMRSEMVLSWDAFAAKRIAWRSKSAMLGELSAELNVGLDSFIFVDDDPVQIAEVRRNCPAVTTIHLPVDCAPARWLWDHWAFSLVSSGKAVQQRQEHYRHEAAREAGRKSSGSFEDFLTFLQLSITHFPCRPDDRDRLLELLTRTNQFNLTGERLTRAALDRRLDEGVLEVQMTAVKDRFADYGIVGAVLFQRDAGAREIRVESLVLSCRVFGRGVELSILQHLTGMDSDVSIVLPFQGTGRNTAAMTFLRTISGRRVTGTKGTLRIDSADVISFPIERFAGWQEVASAAADSNTMAVRLFDDEALTAIARSAGEPSKIVMWLHEGNEPRSESSEDETDLKRIVLSMWRNALKCAGDTGQRSFFEAGGTSFGALQLLTDIKMRFGVAPHVATFFNDPRLPELLRGLVKARRTEVAHEPYSVADLARPLPLLPLQRWLWMLSRNLSDASVLHVPLRLRLDVVEDVGRVFSTIKSVIARHPALQMSVGMDGAGLCQLAAIPSVRICDLRDLPSDTAADIVSRLSQEVMIEPFVLETQAPARCLIAVTSSGCEILAAFHPICCDAASVRRLGRELSWTLSAGKRYSDLLPPPNYAELCTRLVRFSGNAEVAASAARLSGCNFGISLPRQKHRNEAIGMTLGRGELKLHARQVARLKQLVHAHDLKVEHVLLAATCLLLHRYGGQTDLTVGVIVDTSDVTDRVGCFSNIILVRVSVDPNSSFVALLHTCAVAMQAALVDRHIPFDQILRVATANDASPSGGPEVLFSVRAVSNDREAILDESVDENCRYGAVGLAFCFQETFDGAAGVIGFDPQQYDGVLIAGVAGHFPTLIDAVTDAPDLSLNRVRFATPVEQATADRWNNTDTFFAGPRTLTELFIRQVKNRPDAPAIIGPGRVRSYAELAAAAMNWAGCVAAVVPPQQWRSGLVTQSVHEWTRAALGTMLAGGAFVPLETADLAANGPGGDWLTLLCSDDCVADNTGRKIQLSADTARPALRHLMQADPERDCCLIPSTDASGRTSVVSIRHRGIANMIYDINARFGIGPGDRLLTLAPCCSERKIYDVFGTLAAGAAVVALLDHPQSLAALHETMHETAVTVCSFLPSQAVEYCAFLEQTAASPPPALRAMLLSGAPIDDELMSMTRRLLPHVEVAGLFGSAETSIWSMVQPLNAVEGRLKMWSLGRPMANQTALILNEVGELCPPFARGELYIGGEGVAAGYLGDEEKTRTRFIRRPPLNGRFYRTCRQAMYLEDGTIVQWPEVPTIG